MQNLRLILCFLVFQPLFGNAQESTAPEPITEGTIRYLVTHNATKMMEALTYLSKQRKERNALRPLRNTIKQLKPCALCG